MKLSFCQHHLLQILRRFDNQHLPLDLFLSQYFRAHKALGSHDRKQIAESIYEMIRWKLLIDHLSGDEKNWERRYAVYQAFQPHNYFHVNSIPDHVRVSFPKELFQMLVKQYGIEKAMRLCQICNTPAPTTIRINPAKTTREDLLARWKGLYEVTPTEHSPYGIQFKKRMPFFEMPEFKEGLFEVQDEGSQLVSQLAQIKPGDHVLDYCAGSGGKSLAMAHMMQGRGQLYLHDIRDIALEQASKRLARACVQNAQVLSAGHPTLSKLKAKMDWVVVDAPCSGSGTLRRNPDMKWKFKTEMVERLVLQQREIFEKALHYLKPGGHITYLTCSLLKEENENQLEFFLKEYPLEIAGDTFCSLPSFDGMDGFFGAVLKSKL